MKCRHVADDQPRAIVGRHREDCPGDCRGCEPCPQLHCIVDGASHLDSAYPQVCPRCVGEIRENLTEIAEMAGMLPERAASATVNSAPGGPPLGGDAMVLLGPVGDGSADALWRERYGLPSLEMPGDPDALLVLANWEDDWRRLMGHGGGPVATIPSAADYLARHLSRMAQAHPAIDEFARDVWRIRRRLEALVRAGAAHERGVPCLHCGKALRRASRPRQGRFSCDGHGPLHVCPVPRQGCCDRGGVEGDWRCPGCGRLYSQASYLQAVKASYLATAPALTAYDLAEQFGISAATVRSWANRGKVRRRGRDGNGRTLFDVEDVRRCVERGNEKAS